jgi:L-fuconolactonase
LTAPRRIDAHQHFWSLRRQRHPWIEQGSVLDRDFVPADLTPLNVAAGIDGTIAVQAAQTVTETDWLLRLAREAPSVLGVVGWAPLDDPEDLTLDRLGADPLCVGVRPMLQDLPDDDWIAAAVRPRELERIAAHGLVFDLLTYPRQLAGALRAFERVPELVVVVDHLSKPSYGTQPGAWGEHMRALAARPNTYCKLSGIVTEIGAGWCADAARRHVDVVLDAFGPERVLFGSDWPVCLLAASHAEVVELADALTRSLTSTERVAVFGGNAARVYGV